jgi:DNA polymerase-3 subunit gamma/tau
MPLHLDYRPDDTESMVGNETTIAAFESIFRRKNKPHAFLFTGPSGCGKTTLARVAVKALDCHESEYTECDAADFRGIEMVRDLRRKMHYMPSRGSCRVWLLDECHKLTPEAQEALLKALEDTPKHVYLLLATTNPEKLKTTLKRRCTPFEMSALSTSQLKEYMEEICDEEKKKVPQEVLKQIASDSIGSLGMALMLLDKIIDMPPKKMLEAAKRAALEESETIELCRALIKKAKWKIIASILKNLTAEPETTRRTVLGYCNSVILNGESGRAFLIMEAFSEPFYDTGAPGLTLACYNALYGE